MPGSEFEVRRRRAQPAAQDTVRSELTVGAADDRAETEADEMAEAALANLAGRHPTDIQLPPGRVARSVKPAAQAAPAFEAESAVEAEPAVEGESAPTVGFEGGAMPDQAQQAIQSAQGSGRPLEAAVRGPLESAFGANFGRVRVHDGANANRISRSIQAEAFTVGNDVFFSAGAYRPQTSGGRSLLAHELGHVVHNDGSTGTDTITRFFDRKKKNKRPKLTADPGMDAEVDKTAYADDEKTIEETDDVKTNESGESALADVKVDDIKEAASSIKPSAFGKTLSLTALIPALRATMSADDVKHAQKQKTTLYRLLLALDAVAAEKHPGTQFPLIQKVGRLTESYLAGHRSSKKPVDQKRVEFVHDIYQQCEIQILRLTTDAKYARDMPADKSDTTADPFKYNQATKSNVATGTDQMALPATENAWVPDQKPGAHQFVANAGMTEGELKGIRTYTDMNYTYMNPAISNFGPGLDKHFNAHHKLAHVPEDPNSVPPGPVSGKDRRELQLEGTAHAGMAMKGLAKIPAWSGVTYRGDNLDLNRMNKLYTLGQTGMNDLMLSTSKGMSTPSKFLRNSGDGPISLMIEFQLVDGRDLELISTVNEAEVMVLPGAKWKTISIEQYDRNTGLRTPMVGQPSQARLPFGGIPTYYVTVKQLS
jgi:hypothetical protein